MSSSDEPYHRLVKAKMVIIVPTTNIRGTGRQTVIRINVNPFQTGKGM